MKSLKGIAVMSLAVMLVAVFVAGALAVKTGENQIQIPIGTKIVKAGDVTKFLLHDGVVEVIGLKGELLIKAYDAKGKLLYTGKQGKIVSAKTGKEILIESLRGKVSSIDDEVTWIKFSPEPTGR